MIIDIIQGLSDVRGTGDPTETLDMDWLHSPQASRQHYKTSLNLESRGEKEKRTTEKHMVPQSASRRQINWLHLDAVGEIGSGPDWLAVSCWRPMPQEGRRRLSVVD